MSVHLVYFISSVPWCSYLLMVMTVSLKFSVSSFADSGLNLVSGLSVFSDTDLIHKYIADQSKAIC